VVNKAGEELRIDGTLELVHWAPAHETHGRGHVASTVVA
jgi:hypothetical protein